MITVLVAALASYMLTSLLGYVIHRAIHRPWFGFINRAHMAHHLRTYPPGDLVSEAYRSAGSQSSVYTFLVAFSPLVIAPVALGFIGVVSWPCAGVIVGAMLLVGLLNDVLHDSYHVRN